MRVAASTVWLLATLGACNDCPEKPDDCVEKSVTLTQGIYGQVIEGDDVVHDESCPQYAQPVSYPVWIEAADGTHVADDTSDDIGAFELVAPAGDYRACIINFSGHAQCSAKMVTVPASGRMRFDISTSVFGMDASPRGPSLCGREP